MKAQIEYVPYTQLKLDPQNPRLPEEKMGASAVELLKLFEREYDLNELAQSYLENGFFTSEALIVNRQDKVVLEGNRRLAALKYLHHDDEAQAAGIATFDAGTSEEEQLDDLLEIPVIFVDDRESLAPYLGFRHINGPKQWLPSAKARYVWQRVKKWMEDNTDSSEDPFYVIGREIGSNRAGVMNQYLQYSILREARDEFKLNHETSYILSKRFGVWSRLNNNLAVLDHIGFSRDRRKSAKSIDEALKDIDGEKLSGLLKDLTPEYGPDGQSMRKAVITDSRQVADYAEVLNNTEALHHLREYRDFKTAVAIAKGLKANAILQATIEQLKLVRDSIENPSEVDEKTRTLANQLSLITEQINTGIRYILNNTTSYEIRS
jgi:hypothetical protein